MVFRINTLQAVVPGGGVEPPRAEARRILSPLRLPVPPSRLYVKSKTCMEDIARVWHFVHDLFTFFLPR